MTDERFKEKDTITVVGPRGGKRVEHLDYRARAIANAAYALALEEVDGVVRDTPLVDDEPCEHDWRNPFTVSHRGANQECAKCGETRPAVVVYPPADDETDCAEVGDPARFTQSGNAVYDDGNLVGHAASPPEAKFFLDALNGIPENLDTENPAAPAPDGEEPYRVAKFAVADGFRYGVTFKGERGAWYLPAQEYGDELERMDSLVNRLNDAFTAGQKGRSDCAEKPRVIESWIDRVTAGDSIEDVARDFDTSEAAVSNAMAAFEHGRSDCGEVAAAEILHELCDHESDPCSLDHHGYCQTHPGGIGDGREGKCPIRRGREWLASRREGEPHEAEETSGPYYPGGRSERVNSVAAPSKVCTCGPSDKCSDCPASPDLVAAAREGLELLDEALTYVSDYFRQKWSMDDRRDEFAAALQNTPQPDESEAVTLLRRVIAEYDATLALCGERFEQRAFDAAEERFDNAVAAAKTFLSNTPEVDDAE